MCCLTPYCKTRFRAAYTERIPLTPCLYIRASELPSSTKQAEREVLQQALFAQVAMASCQCYETVARPCTQDQQNHSLGQKYELASRGLKKEGTQNGKATAKCQTQCKSGKQAEGGVVKTGTLCTSNNGLSTPAPACNAKTSRRGERKKGLLQRIKDGISGHSDKGGGSSSSSESDSDDEKSGKRKVRTVPVVVNESILTVLTYETAKLMGSYQMLMVSPYLERNGGR
ncbi:hypothetical protein SADUNF_Sadunf03G0104500 [Salix dunnii]|uniref:Uncharacterized protein n=1 Tax=Salix dunnii TaxID=1413687 RepID=A0A835KHR3_9ROSI|nr:hypothetical protein SADUNF_Sadunf03G0104500 [Salix dunnii]